MPSDPIIPPIFLTTPLTNTLLTTTPTYTIHTKSTPTSTKLPNPFFNSTLNTSRSRGHEPAPSSLAMPPSAVHSTVFLSRSNPLPEGHLLIHIGTGVTGQHGIAHGGFLATVMDEVCGNLIAAERVDGGLGMFTVRLDVRYLRPVFVLDGLTGLELELESESEMGKGTVIVATARVERVEGRKVFVRGEIRDRLGEVCTTAEAVFVKKQQQPRSAL